MPHTLTDSDRVAFQKALDHLQEADSLTERIDSQLTTVRSGGDAYSLSTLNHAASRLLVVRAKIQTARDLIAGFLDRLQQDTTPARLTL